MRDLVNKVHSKAQRLSDSLLVIQIWNLIQLIESTRNCKKCTKEYWDAFEDVYFELLTLEQWMVSKPAEDLKMHILFRYHTLSHEWPDSAF